MSKLGHSVEHMPIIMADYWLFERMHTPQYSASGLVNEVIWITIRMILVGK